MRIYVAGKYEEGPRIRRIMDALEAQGHTITYDWTQNEQVSSEQAKLDYYGVVNAEALVLIAEYDLRYAGALVEMGIALGLGKHVYVSSNLPPHNSNQHKDHHG